MAPASWRGREASHRSLRGHGRLLLGFPGKGPVCEMQHSKMKGEMLTQGACGPRSGFSRNRSCTQFCTSRGSRGPGSRRLPPAPMVAGICPSLGTSGGESRTHLHTGRPSCLGRGKGSLMAHGDPVLGPLLPPHKCSGPSCFLLSLLSSLKERSSSPTPVTKSDSELVN